MQDARLGNPSVQQWSKSLPPHLCSLTAPDENTPPQPVNTSLKDAQLSRVAGDSMVLVVAQHNGPKPCTDCGSAIVPPALKLSLEGFQLRDHPFLRRDPPDDESSVGELPTEVGEAQECEGLWFSLSALLPVSSGKAPEFDQSRLVRM